MELLKRNKQREITPIAPLKRTLFREGSEGSEGLDATEDPFA